MTRISWLIETIRRYACTIREGLSSEVNRVYGRRAGHVAEQNGSLKAAQSESTEATLKMGKLSSASIMVSRIPNQYTQIASVVSLTLWMPLANQLMTIRAKSIPATSKLKIRRVVMEFGHAVDLIRGKRLDALKVLISALSTPKKKPKSTSLTGICETRLRIGKEARVVLAIGQTSSFTADSVVTLGSLSPISRRTRANQGRL